ncbi:PAS and ANTAR domain-containing protein [Arthrobacter sp. 18067]|uniref:PAS and ANTAR domain-containing protein n=1 Tax=Arthrobacter sp. 18067 TaxID=2681413 RepID=UPI001359862C|nr:PAS and ANTAR domain-containing protein [Arthrobacter sp. 18067]
MTERLESYSYPLGAQERCTVGSFRIDFKRHQAQWSDGMFTIHGYVRGEVVPTLGLVLAHKHPEDRGPIVGLLDGLRKEGGHGAVFHRILDSAGREHRVLTIVETLSDDSRTIVGFQGLMVDLTQTVAVQTRQESAAAVRGAYATKALIEQAKGVIMCCLQTDSDQAFKVLTDRSQRTNSKLAVVAAELIDSVVAGETLSKLRQWQARSA